VTSQSLPSRDLPPSPALAAFLRGIERRAYVFAQVQCGDDEVAQMALGRAMRAFRGTSAVSPLSAWPAGFWALLLAQPELSQGQSRASELAVIGGGPRAALLLRMVGGLDFDHAAQVLGVSEATYRFALQRALQQLGDAGVSYSALGGLRERLRQQVKTLPSNRLAELAALRERVLANAPEPAPERRDGDRPRWLGGALWALLAVLCVAFAATFLPRTPTLAPGGIQGLDEASAPAAPPVVRDSDRVTHPDYAQLSAPADAALAADLAFLSWVASGEAPAPAPDAEGLAEVPEQGDGQAVEPEGSRPNAP
jgi:hypothetical protein